MSPIYLDYAAATPVDEAALAAAGPYFSDQFYNPSAVYESGRRVRKAIDRARAQVADVLGCKDQEIYFTAGGTEANNLAIAGVMQQYPDANCVVSAIEHGSVLDVAKQHSHKLAPVTAKGLLDLQQIEGLIDDSTVLVSIMYANNEVGTVQPIKQLTELVKCVRTQRRTSGNTLPLYVHTDACQASNYLDLHVARLGVDLMTLNGSKIYGFKQSGALYVEKSVSLKPLMHGGGQESSIRSGTENVPGIIAFATMLQKVQSDSKDTSAVVSVMRDDLYATLSQKVPDCFRNGSARHCLPNMLNITLPGVDGERLVMELDNAGILAATGSACSASSDEPSHVLLAMGLSEMDASASLRLSLGRYTTEAEVQKAADIIAHTIIKQRKLVQ